MPPSSRHLLREVQVAGVVGLRFEEDKTRGSTGVLFFRRDDVPADTTDQQKARAHLFAAARVTGD
jgi:hypothetical protein